MVNLTKQERVERINLRKKEVCEVLAEYKLSTKTDIHVEMDRSGSMSGMYNSGEVQEIFERIMPIALTLDQNKSVACGIFHSQNTQLPDVNMNNFHDYVKNEILKHGTGGTNYAHSINDIVDNYTKMESKGLVFKKKVRSCGDIPVLVLFFTDGDNYDKEETKKALIEASKYNIFFQFIGIGEARKDFLEEIDNMSGRFIDNAGFFDIRNVGNLSDKELYKLILKEYPQWLEKAKAKGIV